MLEITLALLIFLFPLAYSPGPGNMFFAANGARFGLRATLPANAGYHLATWAVTAAIGFGFVGAMEASPGLFAAIRWIGSGYVLYLALRFWQAGAMGAGAAARPAGVADGALLLVLNPKGYVIMTLMFSQFLGRAEVGVLWITTVFTLNNLVAFLAYTLLGDWLAAQLRGEAQARAMNRGFALVLAGVAIWMALG
ncbi:LysE family translocator [Halovulum sp. GXIMD14793]